MSSTNGRTGRGGRGRISPVRLLCGASLAAVALALPSLAHAQQDRNWDPNGTAVNSGGTGTWNTSSNQWSPNADGVSGPYTPWTNAGIDNAIFGGLSGTNATVTLGTPITVHNLTFDANTTYTLTGSTLTLAGATPTITTNGNATIGSILAGNAGLTKAGAGVLTLTGTNTFTGGVNVTAGTLSVSGDSSLGAASNAINLSAGGGLLSTGALNNSRVVTLVSGSSVIGGGVGSAHLTGAGGITLGAVTTLNDDTNNFTGPVYAVGYNLTFTSIGNLGQASSLGAAATAADGLINIGSGGNGLPGGGASAIYIGDGDTSNRNWNMRVSGSGTNLINQGTGTLTLTGNFAQNGPTGATVGFVAQTADLELLGVISGGRPITFSGGSTARTITLGGLNDFTTPITIQTVTVKANTLANGGLVSSLGISGNISLNSGILSYTGSGGGTNRVFSLNGASSILNDGTGSLALTGAAVFSPAGPGDTITLGGSFAGGNTLSGVLSGNGNVVMNGAGTWLLSGANTYVGSTTVTGGTLQMGSDQALGAPNALVVNGGTLDLNTHDLEVTSLAGTGGSVALTGADLTVNGTTSTTYAGSITGTGGLSKRGTGTLTLTGQSSYSGATTVNSGTLALNFAAAGAPATNILSSASALNMTGGTLTLTGAAGAANGQTFNGLNVSAGNNRIVMTTGAGGSMLLDLGALNHTGGLLDFTKSATSDITTSNADGALGWATINGTDYAQVTGGHIVAFTTYAEKDDASTWLTGEVVADTGGAANTAFGNTVSGNVQLGGLKYTAAANSTVTVGAGNTLGVDGTILVASSIGNASQTITGGSITGAAGGGTLGVLHNGTGSGTFTIASTIVDNGGATGFAKGGSGKVALTGANSYTGGTTISGGTLAIDSVANGGVASSIGASSADPANLVLENGTLEYTGVGGGTTDRGFTLVNGGPSRTILVDSGNLSFGGVVVGSDDAGFSKTGTGTLTLANAANTYTGATTISGGTLSVSTLANGGVASGIGAASSDAANLVIQTGGTLQYTGATTSTDRGFTLNGTAGGTVDVTNAGTTLTFGGTIEGAVPFQKAGAGTLVFSGINSNNGPTTINNGTLRAGSTQAFGGPNFMALADVAGVTLDLNGFNNKVGGLSGGGANGGIVRLGGATLSLGGTNASFSGVITGAGGLTKDNSSTQTLVGCNNNYTGATSVVGGTLSVDCLANGGQASGIGASTSASANLVLSGGILAYTGGSITIDRGITLGSTGVVSVVNAATVLGISGPIVGGGLRKDGAGTLVLSGNNTYTGITTVTGGILRAGAINGIGKGALGLNDTAGVLADLNNFNTSVGGLNGGGTTGGGVTLGTATLTIASNAGTGNYGGAISGSGGIVKGGTFTQALTGCGSSYTGSTEVRGGILQVGCLANGGTNSAIGASSNAAGNLIISGGTLQYVGAGGSTDRLFTLGASSASRLEASGTGAIAFTGTGPITFAAPGTTQTLALGGTNTGNNSLAAQLTNNGAGVTSLTKDGVGTWILNNPNSSYTGITTINGGVLGVDKLSNGGLASSIGASSAAAANLVIGNGSTLRYTGSGDTTNRLFTLSAGTTFLESSGTGAVVFTDTGPVTLAGADQARTIALGGTNTGNNTLAGSIGNAGIGVTVLAKNDAGTWLLTGNNSYTGATNINAGRLVLGNGGTTGSIASATINNLGTLDFNRSDTLTLGGVIAGTGSVRQTGTGTTVLTGNSSYSGGTTISAGTLQLGNGGTTGSITGNIVDNGTLAFNRSDTVTVTGIISGSGSLAQVGSGTTVLTAPTTLGGSTRIDAGTLQINGNYVTSAIAMNGSSTLVVNNAVQASGGITGNAGASTILVNAGGTLIANGDLGDGGDKIVLSGTIATTAALSLGAGDDTLTLNDGATITNGGAITGGAGTDLLLVNNAAALNLDGVQVGGFEILDKKNIGTLSLTGDHAYSLGTTIEAGVLSVGNGGNTGTLTSDVVNNAALQFNRSNASTFTGNISGTGSVTKLGSGTLSLNGDATHIGGTTITAGQLQIGNGGTTGSIAGNILDNASLGFNRSDSYTYGGVVSGTGSVAQIGAGATTLTGVNTYTGSTSVSAGQLTLGSGGQITATTVLSVAGGGTMVIDGTGSKLTAMGPGTSIIGTSNTGAGVLTVRNGGSASFAALDMANAINSAATLTVDGTGTTLTNTGTMTLGRSGTATVNVLNGGKMISTGSSALIGGQLATNARAIVTVSGAGSEWNIANTFGGRRGTVTVADGGRITANAAFIGYSISGPVINNPSMAMTVTGANSRFETADALTIANGAGPGALTIADGGTVKVGGRTLAMGTGSGTATLNINGGAGGAGILDADFVTTSAASTINFDHDSANYAFAAGISGAGSINQLAGVTSLTGNSAAFAGTTTVSGGTLRVNGTLGDATSTLNVLTGGTLGGGGTIGGNVSIADGILAPGNSPGTLTIGGNLALAGASILNFEFGQANVPGGALNDLVNVGGNLTLDGTLNVTEPAGGTFGPGIYRVFNYGGTLTDNGLDLGSLPAGSDVKVQTSVSGQVNLVNTAGLAFSFWDGAAGPKFNNVINGGNGTWHLAGADSNWTDASGAANDAWSDGTMAIFAGAAGTVTVDNGLGAVTASGMQFATNGYHIAGNDLTLVGPQAAIRVGDGSAAGAGYTATISASLTGASQLVKTDLGTLVLSGTNSYAGGTAINGGTLQIASDANLGAASGGLSFNGGTLNTTTNLTSDRDVVLDGAGTLSTNSATTLILTGDISGAGSLTKIGSGADGGFLVLTGDATHSGGTTISAGILSIGNGGTTGSIAGDIVNNGTLRFQRTDSSTYAGSITGSGAFTLQSGIVNLTGNSSWTGDTTILNGGELRVINGNTVSSGQTILSRTSTLTVSGAGSTWLTTNIAAQAANGTAAINVADGGVLQATGALLLRNSPGTPGPANLNISGAGSLVDLGGTLQAAANNAAVIANVTISDGGTLRSTGANAVGAAAGNNTGPTVTITGSGSNWTSTGTLAVTNGDVSLLNGGAASFASATFGSVAGKNANLLVSDANSAFATTGDLTVGSGAGTGVLTLADGGHVSVGGNLTLADSATATGILNIGGAEGATAAGAGLFDGPALGLGSVTSHINFNHNDPAYTFAALLSGSGAVNQVAGTTILTGANSYAGVTTVTGGTLLVNGDQSAATGLTNVIAGTIGGIGTIGGNVTVADGAFLAPGDATGPGTLAINGSLGLSGTSRLVYDFGQSNVVGGPLNDLTRVAGDLTLNGTIDVAVSPGGSFDVGVYRVISYGGTLNDQGLDPGSMPAGSTALVQTAVGGQVNLVNTAGMLLNYWDGAAGPKNDGRVNGGDGTWQNSTGNNNWTEIAGAVNAAYSDDAFAIFSGAPGTVTVDNSAGTVGASGMQFASNGYAIAGDALTLVGPQSIVRVGDGTVDGLGYTATIDAALTGNSQLVKTDLGTLVLNATNAYTGGTRINVGTVQIARDANLGDAAGALSFDGGTLHSTADITSDRLVDMIGKGTFLTDAGTTLVFTGSVTGSGDLIKDGTGNLALNDTSNHSGLTIVRAGSLFVNGDQSAATGLTSVALGATLGGRGIIGGDVAVADGGTLAPGNSPGTLTINGGLSLTSGSLLNFEFGEANVAGGTLNDLVNVGGNLTLDGTLNVSISAGGTFGPGIYRVFNYGGTLTDNGLVLGTMPGGSALSVQTAVAGQVNLVNTAGLTLGFWDGAAGPKNDGIVNGGNGVWQVGGSSNNWTTATGSPNADYAQDSFAIFSAAPGTVTVDNGGGNVRASGMQFASDGYAVTGDALTLGGASAIIQVGDGSAASAGYTATIDAALTGTAALVKTDAGTLVLTGTNSYAGGTAINGGTLRISTDANLGDAAGGLGLDGSTLNTTASMNSSRAITLVGTGTFATDAATTLHLDGVISGAGALVKQGSGILTLTADNSYGGGTTIAAGSLQIGNGGTTGSVVGNIVDNGELILARSDNYTLAGTISGTGAVRKGGGTAVLTADNSYTGGTTNGSGILQLGNGGTTGSIVGDIVNAGTLVFNRSNDYVFAGAISDTGGVEQAGSGTTILTGHNSYAGATAVTAGTLLINGDQSAATGATAVASSGTLGGTGTIGGSVSVADGGTLAPGAGGAGALTINGSLSLASAAQLDVDFGAANAVGSPLNDVVNIGGDLTLDGTLNVAVTPGGAFGIGLYRIANYGGTLTDNGLAIGTMPAGADAFVQTSVANQVNLINKGGATLNFWDGAAGPKFNGAVNGGDGVWQNGTGNNNWADTTGAVNAGYDDGAFAIFTGAAGTVTIDDSLGAVTASGLQFATDGYTITGDTLTLTGPQATIRVGDGTAAGASYTVTIGAELAGNSQLVKTDAGTLVLSGTSSYTGGTAINGGTVRIASDANLGDAAGGLSFDGGTLHTTADLASARAVSLVGAGSFLTDAGTTVELGGALSGAGSLTKSGTGTLVLSGSGGHAGTTNVGAGTLLIDGDYSAATGATTVASGATLGGNGAIGGNVTLASGATLAPGLGGAGTLAIGGNLSLAAGTTLAYEFGQAGTAGGALNDLVTVGGDLVLDGTINVTASTGGAFDVGVYRVFDYDGTLTNNGLTLGAMPVGSDTVVQTSIAGQVNLVNAAGLTLNFWDGAAGPKNNGIINGGNGIWQNSTGNDNWANANGTINASYSDGAFAVFGGTGGTVTVDNGLGQVSASGMQFTANGYTVTGDPVALLGPQATIRVGDGSTAGAAYTATINAALSGDAQLVKTDAGTLVLGGTNSYTGGTAINGGTVRIASDANLGAAAGAVSLDGGTLATSATMASARGFVMAGAGTISTADATTFTLDGRMTGAGALTKAGAGTLLVTGDNSGYTGATTVSAGTLAVTGSLGGAVRVNGGTRLEGTGMVGSVTNAGTIAPGRDGFGTLSVAGSYASSGGTLEIEAALGGDGSATDRLVVAGGTSGATQVNVTNRGGLGAQTVEGIKIVDVTGGTSAGTFTLDGDYVFQGDQAVIVGAFGYRLVQGGVATPTDGDWYLRSSLLNPPSQPNQPQAPLYQPGVPVYEAYGQALLTLTDLGTMQQRIGNRQWAQTDSGRPSGIWGRMQSSRSRPNAVRSTSLSDVNVDNWKLEVGADHVLSERGDGASLVLGVLGGYGEANASIGSLYGNGSIKAKGYSAGATLTWFGPQGFYVDGRAQVTWFDSKLKSAVLGTLADGNNATGQAYSVEVGKRAPIGQTLSVTPQIQMSYATVGFDRFTDPNGAEVSSRLGDSLKTRWGLSVDLQDARSHLYGIANLSYEWLDGTVTDVSGAPIARENHRLWGELGAGGSLLIGDRLTLYTEASANTAVNDFGKSYSLKGTAGLRLAF